MDTPTLNAVPETLRAALAARGFSSLTPVQEAVVTAEPGRDLRVSSQTGSGKTVAFGLALARELEGERPAGRIPRALVLTPTRELAQQVHRELSWLLAPLGVKVLSVTGGTSVRGDLRALQEGADVIVGTPGRLADHVRTGAAKCDAVRAVVLDEADEMLEMGFREELEAVLDAVPEGHRTHLVSATFADAVRMLAERYQQDPISIEGTPLGDANADIEHIVHLIHRHERDDALINLLLASPDEVTLVFVKTREGAAEVVRKLREDGFGALLLTGDLDQRERQRTLEMFRAGRFRILVATDVAARGLDVPGITRVIHADPPEDSDAYTHRSGRTGRAGKKGTSHILVPKEAQPRIHRLLGFAKVEAKVAKVPDPEAIVLAAEERALAAILDSEGPEPDESALRLAQKLVEDLDPLTLAQRLLSRSIPKLPAEPRVVTPVEPNHRKDPRDKRPRREAFTPPEGGYVRFQVSWGANRGADARRLLAILCRRGNVTKDAIGAIQVGFQSSFVEVRADAARGFESGASRPDPRDPHVRIRRAVPGAGGDERGPRFDRGGFQERGDFRGDRGGFPERNDFRGDRGGDFRNDRGDFRDRGPAPARDDFRKPAGDGGLSFRPRGDAPPWSKKPERTDAPAAWNPAPRFERKDGKTRIIEPNWAKRGGGAPPKRKG